MVLKDKVPAKYFKLKMPKLREWQIRKGNFSKNLLNWNFIRPEQKGAACHKLNHA